MTVFNIVHSVYLFFMLYGQTCLKINCLSLSLSLSLSLLLRISLGKKATIHQMATMLATSKRVLFPGHNHLLTNGADDPSLAGARVIIKVSGYQQLVVSSWL